MTRRRDILGALFFAVSLFALGGREAAAAGPMRDAFPHGELQIQTRNGLHRFSVELALTPEQQALGLMYRSELPADAGMLFIHPWERPTHMWMKNTLIPLDMLFLAGDGTIVRIAEEAEPLSTRTISSGAPVKGVLELPGGTARRLGIEPGDRVLHPALQPRP